MSTTTHIRQTLVAATGAALAVALVAGCGTSPADRRAAELERSTAAVSAGAAREIHDGWEWSTRQRHQLRLERIAERAAEGCH
jgi:hypothetical protein